jgi:sec-independent protein translocase protein TatA
MQLYGLEGNEWLIIIVVFILIFFGVKRIPELARSFGKASSEFERSRFLARREIQQLKEKNRIITTIEREKLESIADKLGDQAVTPMFNASAMGSNSRSGVLSIRLYSICKPVNSVHPFRFARVLACETIQAGASETPMYKILPALTISSRARIISSIGVRGSHA